MTGVGLIGYGYWGPNLARNLAETDPLQLLAIADVRLDRREAADQTHDEIVAVRNGPYVRGEAGMLQPA